MKAEGMPEEKMRHELVRLTADELVEYRQVIESANMVASCKRVALHLASHGGVPVLTTQLNKELKGPNRWAAEDACYRLRGHGYTCRVFDADNREHFQPCLHRTNETEADDFWWSVMTWSTEIFHIDRSTGSAPRSVLHAFAALMSQQASFQVTISDADFSQMTGIPVRRQRAIIKFLVEQDWLSEDRRRGVKDAHYTINIDKRGVDTWGMR